MMEKSKCLEIIKDVGIEAFEKEGSIIFEISDIEVKYKINEGKFWVSGEYFGKIPHVAKDGIICLQGSVGIGITEWNEEIFLKSVVQKYLPWLFNLPLELKLLEFIFEIEYYIIGYLGYKATEKKLNRRKVYKEVKITTTAQLWELLEEMEEFCVYKIYVNKFEDYAIFLQKEKNEIFYERDAYKKARQRVVGAKCDNINGMTAFIGVGSVNSYIIKYCLANGLNEVVLIDHDKFAKDNAFRFAFPYKGKKKIYAVNEFCKNLEQVKLKLYNTNINSNSDAVLVNSCKRIIVSVDNYYSWFQIEGYLKNAKLNDDVEIVFAAINNFGENAKFVRTNPRNLEKKMYEFIFESKVTDRREMIGNGCGRSIAIYDEEILIKLAKAVVNAIIKNSKEDEIVYVDI